MKKLKLSQMRASRIVTSPNDNKKRKVVDDFIDTPVKSHIYTPDGANGVMDW